MQLNDEQRKGYATMADNLNVVAIAALAVQSLPSSRDPWIVFGLLVFIPILFFAGYHLRKENENV